MHGMGDQLCELARHGVAVTFTPQPGLRGMEIRCLDVRRSTLMREEMSAVFDLAQPEAHKLLGMYLERALKQFLPRDDYELWQIGLPESRAARHGTGWGGQ